MNDDAIPLHPLRLHVLLLRAAQPSSSASP